MSQEDKKTGVSSLEDLAARLRKKRGLPQTEVPPETRKVSRRLFLKLAVGAAGSIGAMVAFAGLLMEMGKDTGEVNERNDLRILQYIWKNNFKNFDSDLTAYMDQLYRTNDGKGVFPYLVYKKRKPYKQNYAEDQAFEGNMFPEGEDYMEGNIYYPENIGGFQPTVQNANVLQKGSYRAFVSTINFFLTSDRKIFKGKVVEEMRDQSILSSSELIDIAEQVLLFPPERSSWNRTQYIIPGKSGLRSETTRGNQLFITSIDTAGEIYFSVRPRR